jgi:phage tail-like protein
MRSIISDPLRNFKFRVRIPRYSGEIGFQSVAGLAVQTEPITYREGGDNTTTRKMPGQSDFPPIVLTRGFIPTASYNAWNWMRNIFNVVQGMGTGAPGNEFRTDFTVAILDHPVTTVNSAGDNPPVRAVYKIYSAWPSSLAYSDLDATANGLFVEQMTLMHEGFDIKGVPENSTSYLPITGGFTA